MYEVGTPAPTNSALQSAARFVVRCGLPTTVVVRRRPGIVPAARALADSCGLKVRVQLNPLTTTVRFSRMPTILN